MLKGENFTASGDLHEIQALGLTDCLWGPSSTRTFFDEVKIYYQPLHDLSITRVAPSSTVVEEGRKVPINITVANQGDLTETFKLTTYANTNIIANLTNITLTSGNSTTITFTWNTKGVAKETTSYPQKQVWFQAKQTQATTPSPTV